jgi:hypothetical protein
MDMAAWKLDICIIPIGIGICICMECIIGPRGGIWGMRRTIDGPSKGGGRANGRGTAIELEKCKEEFGFTGTYVTWIRLRLELAGGGRRTSAVAGRLTPATSVGASVNRG